MFAMAMVVAMLMMTMLMTMMIAIYADGGGFYCDTTRVVADGGRCQTGLALGLSSGPCLHSHPHADMGHHERTDYADDVLAVDGIGAGCCA